MLSLRRLRQTGKYLKSAPPRRRAIRVFLMVCVLGLACWAFWHNAERKISKIGGPAKGAAMDETGTLSASQEDMLSKYVGLFFQNYGARLVVRITAGPAVAPDGSADLSLVLSPSRKEVFVGASPLVMAALGAKTLSYLRDEHFKSYFDAGNWPEGLAVALSMISRDLDQRLDGQSGSDLKPGE